MKYFFFGTILFICSIHMPFVHADSMTVVYPKQGIKDDKTGYPIELLRLAIERSDHKDKVFLQPSSIEVPQNRVLKLLEQDVVLDIAWSMTDKEREKHLRAIAIPIYKGYFGFRIFLINNNRRPLFTETLSLQTMKEEMIGVQGHDWPDLTILRDNGFHVTSSPNYTGMFDMLNRNRVDYFPRSVLEAWHEENRFPEFDIGVEAHILLHYPAAVFFFVNKDSVVLANIIEQGLKNALKDGSFDVLFDAAHGDFIEKSALSKRRIFSLNNPLFDPSHIPLLALPPAGKTNNIND